MLYFDPTYMIIIPAILFAMYAQFKVNSTLNQFSRIPSRYGDTAAKVARRILDLNGLTNVGIESVNGNWTDHYDPRTNVVRLSSATYGSTSISAIGVAAHEVGHAIQHAQGYAPIKIRNAFVPVVQIGSNLAMPLVLMGLLFSFQWLITIGIFLYTFIVLFQGITLPVEFNASKRALATLGAQNILDEKELQGAKKVLSAAAMTYVAALVSALLSLLRLLLLANRRNNRD